MQLYREVGEGKEARRGTDPCWEIIV